MDNWNSDLDAAPKDGSRILAYGMIALESVPGIATVAWCKTYGVWWSDPNEASEYNPEDCKITHWMPLPEPPK
jgi:hypothetical protein